MEKERRKYFTKEETLLRDNNITKCLVLERSASTMELSKTGLQHEHALLSYTKKREKNTQEAMQLWNDNTSKSLMSGRKPKARKLDKTTFCTANATENLVSDEGTATRKFDKTIMYVVSTKRHARDEVASRKFSSVSMCHGLATAINVKREWTRTHEGAMCAADATRPFVLGRSGQYGCSWAPIVH
jgi:hypothetical protein